MGGGSGLVAVVGAVAVAVAGAVAVGVARVVRVVDDDCHLTLVLVRGGPSASLARPLITWMAAPIQVT